MTKIANQNWYWMHEASIKIPAVIRFCKYTVMYDLHTKYRSVIHIHEGKKEANARLVGSVLYTILGDNGQKFISNDSMKMTT